MFFGDSITDIWHLDEYFPGKPYLNRGIGGQTTPQMLVRFRQDVIDLQPKVVIILAGTNDIAGNTGPMRNEDIEADFASLAELARANNIKVIYSSVLPGAQLHGEIERLFRATLAQKDHAAEQLAQELLCGPSNGLVPISTISARWSTRRGCMKKELADDGLHPNAAGYKIMAPMAEAAIEKALPSSKP